MWRLPLKCRWFRLGLQELMMGDVLVDTVLRRALAPLPDDFCV